MIQSAGGAATYVFCIVQSKRAPFLRGVAKSLPGAGDVRLVPLDRDLWVVVADAPLDRFSAEQIQHDLQDIDRIARHALAHASVIEYFFRRSPVVPLKLFTLFATDERAIAHMRRRRATLRRLFTQVRGLEEWGVRMTIEAQAEALRVPDEPLASGRQYLEIKKRLRDRAPARPAVAKEAAKGLASLDRLAAKVHREKFPPPGPGHPLVVAASFLVRADRRAAWKASVAKLESALAKGGNRLELSGPWPPYHFVTNR